MGKSDLSRYSVLDMTQGPYGEICSEYLALLGMRVIRIDKPSDMTLSKEERAVFLVNNLNKKCITLDYENPQGREILNKLLEGIDVVVVNKPESELTEQGIDYDSIKASKPNIIYANIPPYSTGSPWEGMPSDEAVISAMSGATYATGYLGYKPVEPGSNLPDVSSCGYMATAIMAALYHLEETGEGQQLEVSQHEAVISHSRALYSALQTNKKNIRVGNGYFRRPETAPCEMYRCAGPEGKENFFYINCIANDYFLKLCDAIGRPDLKTDPRFEDIKIRAEHRAELDAIIEDWAKAYDKFEIMDLLLRKNRVIATAVYTIEDIVNSEDLRRLGALQKIEDPELGEMWLPAFPSIYDENDIVVESPKNKGAANYEVFGELGIEDSKIEQLSTQKVI